ITPQRGGELDPGEIKNNYMDIFFKERPTDDLVKRYISKLEEYLDAHDVLISIEIKDHPFGPMVSTFNGAEIAKTYFWLGQVSIECERFGKISMRPPRFGLKEGISDKEIWIDAYQIQNEMYSNNSEFPARDDDYWKLWSNHLPQ
ncbi:MAG: hypothetical protein CO030_01875, partial [Candidatus Magasanikbacteria bacterium CG_4_9_14_0_2_um_filter_42_11]